jgi:hypothetical protein
MLGIARYLLVFTFGLFLVIMFALLRKYRE